ncbi:hypothetical protein [Bergeyella cardium]|uniref:Uncharacterized protein n=1 Tax=Bergeyella cardium TaxID=1585976 RepID=A0A6P1QS26_9FLAO|nr:hypothetical protein [Bergeyella cardium]QHN64465.1 hypothetical protein DBX24_00440 [Bergeyella cardium]WHE33756.1 hypothetical protein P8603_00440 [Bergeyella cardium]WHF60406.1 hypothetical protein O0R51_00440 [Bergeyella cardium]
MKKLFSILMIALILLVTFQRGLVVIHFKLNQDYIEKEYCVNKSKPSLNCHGQCHLKKELSNTADDNLEKISIYKTIELIIPSTDDDFKILNPKFSEQKNIPFYKERLISKLFIKRDLRPPTSI